MGYGQKNIDALQEIIKRYESITDDMIKKVYVEYKERHQLSLITEKEIWERMPYLVKKEYILDGHECLLCKSLYKESVTDKNCKFCILYDRQEYKFCTFHITYISFDSNCTNHLMVYEMIKARINYLKKVLKEKAGIEL